MKAAVNEQLQQTIVLDYLKEEILSFVNNGTQRAITLEYVGQNNIVTCNQLTQELLRQSFYLVDSTSGKRVSKNQKALLLRGIDCDELTQQRNRMRYLVKHHPNMVIKEYPKGTAPEIDFVSDLKVEKEPFHWRSAGVRLGAVSALVIMTVVFVVGLVDSVKYVASLFS